MGKEQWISVAIHPLTEVRGFPQLLIKDSNSQRAYDLVNHKINEHVDELNVKDKQLAKRKYLNKFFYAAGKQTDISNLLIRLGRIEKLNVSLEKDKDEIYYLKFVTPK